MPTTVFIASFLEDHLLTRLADQFPGEVEFIYEPDLLPPPRYIADHIGPPDFTRSPAAGQRWAELISRADIAFDFPYRNRHPREYAPALKWIQTTSAGVGQTVAHAGIRPGELIITTASGVHARPLAEFAFMVLLMASKNYGLMRSQQDRKQWERYCGTELTGDVLAIIGPGKIGQEIARIARCFDMRPVALARDFGPDRASQLGMDRLFRRDELPDMLALADALVICAPRTPETENIMDRAAFAALKRGVTVISIGRGHLVDESALLEKLKDGTIALAGLDVFQSEPLPPDSPFWELPNVIVSPHSASTTDRENERIIDIFAHNLRAWLDGNLTAMMNVLDIERMY